MEYKDALGNPIQPGFYFETFYKDKDAFPFCTGKDLPRNHIVLITGFPGVDGPYVVSNQAKPIKLNPNYSQWLIPTRLIVHNLVSKLASPQTPLPIDSKTLSNDQNYYPWRNLDDVSDPLITLAESFSIEIIETDLNNP